MSAPVYFRQFLAGVDFATDDGFARDMRNFAYAIGDPSAGVAVLVDPAYRPLELVGLVRDDGLEVVGAVATHYHPDHAGGEMMGRRLAGVAELVAERATPVHVQRDEVEWMVLRTGLDESAFVAHDPGDVLMVGDVAVTLVHTPGHTPGSQCLLLQGRLVSGDTLFLQGCGRTDLPGSDAREMYRSLQTRLGAIDDDVVVFPGHLYAPEGSASLRSVRATNPVLAPASEEQWLAWFGS